MASLLHKGDSYYCQFYYQGHRFTVTIGEVPSDEPNRIMFSSVGGTMELAGMIELYPIRPNLTEAVLTVEYEAVSPLQKAIETMAMAFDRFLNRQLARIEGCMESARTARV